MPQGAERDCEEASPPHIVGRGTARSAVEGLLKSYRRLGCGEEPLRHGAKARRATSPSNGEETMVSHRNDAGSFLGISIACRIMSPISHTPSETGVF